MSTVTFTSEYRNGQYTVVRSRWNGNRAAKIAVTGDLLKAKWGVSVPRFIRLPASQMILARVGDYDARRDWQEYARIDGLLALSWHQFKRNCKVAYYELLHWFYINGDLRTPEGCFMSWRDWLPVLRDCFSDAKDRRVETR